MSKKLNILIATINNRIIGLENIISNDVDVIFTISHQVIDKLDFKSINFIKKIKNKNNVIYSEINSKGVAKNRNNALKHRIKNTICLLCDDDVIYFEDSFKKILFEFENDPSLEFLTFKIKTFGGKDYKRYREYSFKHNIKTLSNIGIIDVAFKEEVIKKYSLSFDERFGPGAYYSIGEDFIFMTEAVKKKANIIYKPLEIVQHDDIGTGQILRDDIILGRGAMFAKVFGYFSFFLNIYFSLKNFNKYKNKYSIIGYNKLLLKGSWHFLISHDEK